MYITKILIFVAILIQNVFGSKIMAIFPVPSKSHVIFGSALLKELASRGHEVTMVSPFPLENPPKNYKDIFLEEGLVFKEIQMTKFMDPNVTMFEKLLNLPSNMEFLTEYVIINKDMQKILNSNEKFDLVIQLWGANEAILGIAHKLNASTIGFSIAGGNSIIGYPTGNPTPHAYVPNLFFGYTDNMTFFQRVINSLSYVIMELLQNFANLKFQNRILHEHFPEAPHVEELINNVDLMLVNSHVAIETARPFLPNLVQIGGFHIQEKETMSDDLKEFLDNSKNGVIFFSLGTNVKSADFSQDKLQDILKSFEKSKFDILWKFEYNLPNKPKNVKISSWLPQNAILAHPKIKAFITHGGLGSLVEAVYHGVPMIFIPFFGDQQKNAAGSVENGYGILLELEDINEHTLTRTINEITENPSYKNNIMIRSDAFRNQEMNPMDKAVYWIEHVIKHKGAKHLKSYAIHIPWYQYMLLDVIAFIAVVIFSSLALFYYITKKIFLCLFRKICKQSNKKHKKA